MIIKFILIASLIFGSSLLSSPNPKFQHEALYRSAQRDLTKKNYKRSLESFLKYIELTKKDPFHKQRLFWAIDHVSHIYLRINQNPEQAIKFFSSFEKDKRLTDEQLDIIEEWKTVSRDWQKNNKKKIVEKNAEKIFQKGLAQYRTGIKKDNNKGNANLSLASSYFSKLIFDHSDNKNVGRALYIMGDIKSRLRTDIDYWGENFYLKEVINRYPHTKLSWKAWERLNEDTRLGYTGSSGDNTPPEMIYMLSRYKKRAALKKKK
jgi:tetratricopeptide (TPR) repeat protein